jgi:hypothetical protein
MRQEEGFIVCFPLNILMIHSPKPTIIANNNNLTGIGFAWGETIRFGSLEFIANRFGNLSISPEGNDSDAVFMRMVHSRLSSLHAILEESTDEDNIVSSGRANSDFPISQGCNMVTPIVPITTAG